jgi:hypothetical protein
MMRIAFALLALLTLSACERPEGGRGAYVGAGGGINTLR